MKVLILIFLIISNNILKNDISKINKLTKNAEKAFKEKNYKIAINDYNTLIDSFNISNKKIHLNLAHSYLLNNDTLKAIKNYNMASVTNDKKIKSIAYQQLGNINESKNKLKNAAEFYKKSILSNNSNLDSKYNYELVTKKLKEHEKKKQEKKKQENKEQNNKEKENKEKLLVFEEIIKITKLISMGDLSQKMSVGKIKSNEIRELQKNINFAIDQLSKVESDRAAFSAMITHELKTPLVPIKGYAQMLQKEKYGKLTLFQKDAIIEIERSSNVLYKLIGNILSAQKLDSGKVKMNLTHMSSSKLLNMVYLSLSPLMIPKNIKFNKIILTDSLILIDYEKILEVFVNLVQNSVDFVSPIDGKISITGSKSDEGVLFSVEDNGEGIPLSDQQNLFKKYYQVDTSASRKHGGSGLGLAICKGIVENIGGKIWLSSIVGKGTTFYFSIPNSD